MIKVTIYKLVKIFVKYLDKYTVHYVVYRYQLLLLLLLIAIKSQI